MKIKQLTILCLNNQLKYRTFVCSRWDWRLFGGSKNGGNFSFAACVVHVSAESYSNNKQRAIQNIYLPTFLLELGFYLPFLGACHGACYSGLWWYLRCILRWACTCKWKYVQYRHISLLITFLNTHAKCLLTCKNSCASVAVFVLDKCWCIWKLKTQNIVPQ